MPRDRSFTPVGPPKKIRVSPTHLANSETGEIVDNLFVKKNPTKSENKSERPEDGTPGLPKEDGSP